MIKFNFSIIRLIIFLILISSNVIPTKSLISNQIPDPPQFDDLTYLGYEFGSAGISIALLEAYSLPNIDDKTKDKILEIVQVSLESLWDARILYEGIQYPTWVSSIDEQYLSVYPGMCDQANKALWIHLF